MRLACTLLCVLAAAALVPHGTLAQDDDVGDAMPDEDADDADTSELWPNCLAQLEADGNGATTHSLADIFETERLRGDTQTPDGEDVQFLSIVAMADAATQALLNDFDLDSPGFTLIVPRDGALVVDAAGIESRAPVLEANDIDLATLTTAEATAIVHAHLLEGTIGFTVLTELTQGSEQVTLTSINGFEWLFEGRMDDDGNSFTVLVDTFGLTNEGFFNIATDITATQPDACPNAVITIDSFIATPALVEDLPLAPPLPTFVDAAMPAAAPGAVALAPGVIAAPPGAALAPGVVVLPPVAAPAPAAAAPLTAALIPTAAAAAPGAAPGSAAPGVAPLGGDATARGAAANGTMNSTATALPMAAATAGVAFAVLLL